jgi:hypothetical protein
MRKLGLLLWMLAFTAVGAQAQNIIKSLERTVPGQGKVTIHQDPKIEALIGVERPSMGEQKVLKAAGFRIQAYAGNNTREAKNDAYRVASRIKEYFPELTIYTSFNPPRWLCRVGDFRARRFDRYRYRIGPLFVATGVGYYQIRSGSRLLYYRCLSGPCRSR